MEEGGGKETAGLREAGGGEQAEPGREEDGRRQEEAEIPGNSWKNRVPRKIGRLVGQPPEKPPIKGRFQAGRPPARRRPGPFSASGPSRVGPPASPRLPVSVRRRRGPSRQAPSGRSPGPGPAPLCPRRRPSVLRPPAAGFPEQAGPACCFPGRRPPSVELGVRTRPAPALLPGEAGPAHAPWTASSIAASSADAQSCSPGTGHPRRRIESRSKLSLPAEA